MATGPGRQMQMFLEAQVQNNRRISDHGEPVPSLKGARR